MSANMKKIIIALMMLSVGMTTMAQTYKNVNVEPADMPEDGGKHAMTIYFVNGDSITYSLEELDSVVYLPGIGMKLHFTSTTECKDYLFSQMTRIVYLMEEEEEPPVGNGNENANWNVYGWDAATTTASWRLEYPQMNPNRYSSTNKMGNQVVYKETSNYGITYSIEWDNAKVANRWTCYQMHAGNMYNNVTRTNSFKIDPDVERCPTTDYSGNFSRGHLCPSSDRLCSREQNSQTFYMTNMQPQWQNHNGVLWVQMEDATKEFAGSKCEHICDTLYVVKAATISDVFLDGKQQSGVYTEYTCTSGGYSLPVPKYFYMAFLHYNKALNKYHAMAFWTLHENVSITKAKLGDYAISIDELERRTGIDFFCNLPDDIEDEVESNLDIRFWNIKTSQ